MDTVYFEDELPLNHETCLNHWAALMADGDIKSGYYLSWDHAYESNWMWLDAEFNYTYEYKEIPNA